MFIVRGGVVEEGTTGPARGELVLSRGRHVGVADGNNQVGCGRGWCREHCSAQQKTASY